MDEATATHPVLIVVHAGYLSGWPGTRSRVEERVDMTVRATGRAHRHGLVAALLGLPSVLLTVLLWKNLFGQTMGIYTIFALTLLITSSVGPIVLGLHWVFTYNRVELDPRNGAAVWTRRRGARKRVTRFGAEEIGLMVVPVATENKLLRGLHALVIASPHGTVVLASDRVADRLRDYVEELPDCVRRLWDARTPVMALRQFPPI